MVTKLMFICYSTFIYLFFIVSYKIVHKDYNINISISSLERLALFGEKYLKKFICVFIFWITTWSSIFLLDAFVYTWVTNSNKEEIEQKIISTSTWTKLAMFLKVLACHTHRIRVLDLVGRICRNLFQL